MPELYQKTVATIHRRAELYFIISTSHTCPSKRQSPYVKHNRKPTSLVGYAGNALDDDGGFVAIAPQFLGIGNDGMKLKEMVPSTTTTTSLRRKIQIQLLTTAGKKSVAYRWEGQSGKTWIAEKSTDDMGETEIPSGQGLWVVNTANCEANFQTAGEVGTSDVIQPLDDDGGFVMTGNSFPVPVKLKDIVVSTDTTTSLRRKVQIQLLTTAGKKSVAYRWEGQGGKTWIAEKSTDDMGETEIPAGQGIWVVNTANCAATIRIPAPNL